MPLSLTLAILVGAGAAAGVALPSDTWRLIGLGALGCAIAGCAAWRSGQLALGRVFGGLALSVLAACHGLRAVADVEHGPLSAWFDAQLRRAGQPDATPALRLGDPVRLRGLLRQDAVPGLDGVRLQIDVTGVQDRGSWASVAGIVTLTVGGEMAVDRAGAWRAGRPVWVSAMLRRAASYRNAGVPDGEKGLARRGIALVGSVKSAALVDVTGVGWWWDERAADARAAVRAAMSRRVAPWDDLSAAIGTAILIGDRAQLTPELERRLQEAGTYHVVAISGGNIALLASAVLALLWLLGQRHRGAAVIAVVVLVAHAWVIGGGASVVRATVMAAIYLMLRAIDQRTAPVHTVAVTAALMLAVDPLAIADAGFWLTFGATGALLAVAARTPTNVRGSWWRAPVTIVLGSLAVEFILAPISAMVFQRVTLAGIVLNLVAVPAMACVQAAASVCALADAAGLDIVAAVAGGGVHLAAIALVESATLVEWIPWVTWRVPPPSLLPFVAYYLVVVVGWLASAPPADTRRRRRSWRASAVVAPTLWAWLVLSPGSWRLPADGRLHLTMIDVGQGDAILITCPDGTTVLVDAGGLAAGTTFDVGDRVVGPALRARGVRRLDYLAITHADADHAGGVASILRDFAPREIWVGVPVPASTVEQELQVRAATRRSAWRWLRRGDRLALGDVRLHVLHPPEPDWERQRVRNDDSLVLELRLGQMSLVLTGDVTARVESALLAQLDPRRVIVLKVAHHGSATSSAPSFLTRLAPVAALISAGRGNPFGHPAPAVLDRLRTRGAEVFRTDTDGQIELTTDGRSLEITSVTGRRWRLR